MSVLCYFTFAAGAILEIRSNHSNPDFDVVPQLFFKRGNWKPELIFPTLIVVQKVLHVQK